MFLGREKELKEFNRIYNLNTFQMIVLYGRRRVGKTTLLKSFVKINQLNMYKVNL